MLRTIHLSTWLLLAFRANAQNQQWETCSDSAVQVTSLEVLCDSNQTYYYGSGVHRNSATCDDEDKATLSMEFDVEEDLGDVEDIYMTWAVYNEDYDMVYQESATSLCENVGEDCIYQGSYAFSKQVQLTSVGGASEFVPLVRIAFSAGADGGYNLGGVNLDACVDGKSSSGSSGSKSGGASAGGIAGIIIAVIVVVAAAAYFLFKHKGESKPAEHVLKGGARMDQADYGIVLGETSVNPAPLLKADGTSNKDEDSTDDEESQKDEEAAKQNKGAESSSDESSEEQEDPKKSLKRGQSLLRFLRKKSMASKQGK